MSLTELCGAVGETGTDLSPECKLPRGHAGPHRSGLFSWRTVPPSYTCPRCGARSFNPNDLKHRYCGFCHKFEDEP